MKVWGTFRKINVSIKSILSLHENWVFADFDWTECKRLSCYCYVSVREVLDFREDFKMLLTGG